MRASDATFVLGIIAIVSIALFSVVSVLSFKASSKRVGAINIICVILLCIISYKAGGFAKELHLLANHTRYVIQLLDALSMEPPEKIYPALKSLSKDFSFPTTHGDRALLKKVQIEYKATKD
jgi:hypothetical protein